MGGGQREINAVKARGIKAHDECHGTETNRGGATEEMGSRESEEERLNDNTATAGVLAKSLRSRPSPFAAIVPTDSALFHDSRQSLVRPDRRILKLSRLLPRRWRSLPLELPCESSRKRSGDDTQGVPGKLGILLGGFRESKAVQLRVDLNRLHAIIIPSQMENGGIREVWKIGPSRRLWGNGSGMLWWQ